MKTISMIPRGIAFKNEKCVAVGCCTDLYRGKPNVKTMVIDFPTDHYDFFGPINPHGLTLAEINQKIAEYIEK
jgi:hypothetical protein